MTLSRATLATTALLLFAGGACSDSAGWPTEPRSTGPTTSIPGSAAVHVRTGRDAEKYADSIAADWAANGDTRLARHLDTLRARAVGGSQPNTGRSVTTGHVAPTFIIGTGTDGSGTTTAPTPSTYPTAEIYYSSTGVFVSGRTATIVASVTYFGNIASTEVTSSARDASGNVVIPENRVVNRGLGEQAPCAGSWTKCVWTFKLQTVVTLNLSSDCGITVTASSNHRAEWTTPSAYRLPGATWGSVFSADSPVSASNGVCAPKCLDVTATNYGGSLPCTYPSPVSGGDESTPPTSPTYYDPNAPLGPYGYWQCTMWYLGTDYQTEHCDWISYYPARLSPRSPALSRSALASTATSTRTAEQPSVFVIVSDQVPAGALAVIERHRQGTFRNVLLVPSNAIRPAVLVAVLRALSDSRANLGETPPNDLQIVLKGDVQDAHIPAAARSYAATFTALIASARPADAGAYGTRPMLELRLGSR
jgi:hypothetical protein